MDTGQSVPARDIAELAGFAPPTLHAVAAGTVAAGRSHTVMVTNVPGPATALKLCGSTLRQTMFWVPASGDVGVGVSILSYAGGVQFGLITDQRLCPEPQQIIDRFEPEFHALLLATLMLPWGLDAA